VSSFLLTKYYTYETHEDQSTSKIETLAKLSLVHIPKYSLGVVWTCQMFFGRWEPA